jgi:hypothetical protein
LILWKPLGYLEKTLTNLPCTNEGSKEGQTIVSNDRVIDIDGMTEGLEDGVTVG